MTSSFRKLVASGTNGREERMCREERMWREDLKLIPIREVGKHLIYKHEEKLFVHKEKMAAHVLLCQLDHSTSLK